MPEQNERPRPHGDPLEQEIVEPNTAQRKTDATVDVAARLPEREEPAPAGTSTANGLPAGDEAEGQKRRKLYEEGAELVSRID